MKDIDGDIIIVSVFLYDAKGFVKFSNPTFTMTPTDDDQGNYTVAVVLTDKNPNPLSNFYHFNITVKSTKGIVPKLSKTLNATITSISNYGEVNITFNENIDII